LVLAIGYLHEKDIIYRDLKPENILIAEDGYLCLTDFGLAKILENGEQASTFCGTPDYMAPEIVVGYGGDKCSYSFPVDWWSVGILTYEMIYGLPTYFNHQYDEAQTLKNIQTKKPWFPDP
jgi:serum/glucocorticoid-regulated kinase 2